MRTINSIVSMFVVLVLSVAGLYAQADPHEGWGTFRPLTTACEPCTFPSGNWDTIVMSSQVVYLEGCTFEVKFKKRVCGTDGCQELKIYAIEPTNPVPCTDIDDDLIPDLVVGKLVITDNGMGFEPDTARPGASGCWRIIRPRCWRKRLTTGPDPCIPAEPPESLVQGSFFPCDIDECCVNVLYPMLPNCGPSYTFYEPKGEEYLSVHRQVSLPGSLTQGEINAADKTFLDQFTTKACEQCSVVISPPPGSGTISLCDPSCNESLMAQYNNAVAELIRRRYDH